MSQLLRVLFQGRYKEDIFLAENLHKPGLFWIPECGRIYADPRYQEINIGAEHGCIAYVISGSGIVISNEKIFVTNPGDTCLFCPKSDYSIYSDCIDPMEILWFRFAGEFAEFMISSHRLGNTTVFRNTDTSELILRIQKEVQSGEKPRNIQNKTSITFMKIIQYLQANKASLNLDNMSLAESVKAYIDYHLSNRFTIDYIAKFYNKTPRYVTTTFRNEYKIPPYQYFLQEKVKFGAAIIRATHQPYNMIAEMLNIADDRVFKEHFREVFGLQPTEYHLSKLQEAIDKVHIKFKNQNI